MVVMLPFRFFCPVSEGSDDGHQIRFFKLQSQPSGTDTARAARGWTTAAASRANDVARWRQAPTRVAVLARRSKEISTGAPSGAAGAVGCGNALTAERAGTGCALRQLAG